MRMSTAAAAVRCRCPAESLSRLRLTLSSFSQFSRMIRSGAEIDGVPALRVAEPNEIQFGSVVHLNDSHQHENVHYMVRIEEEIEFARKASFGDAQCANDSS